MKTLIGFVVVILLTACSPALKFQESFVSKDLNFYLMKGNSLTVFGVSNITLSEFKETFKDAYSDTSKLNIKIISDFKTQFAIQIPSMKVKSDQRKIPTALVGEFSFKDDNKAEIDNFFNSVSTDYMLFVHNLDIGNSYNTYTHFNANPNMPGTMMTSTTEDCKISAEIECWDVKQQKRLFRIKSFGSSTVVLFTFLNSLNSALSEAIENGVKYIADNGKK